MMAISPVNGKSPSGNVVEGFVVEGFVAADRVLTDDFDVVRDSVV